MNAGVEGEWAAARFLESRGYRIVAKNHRCRGGEIDLVAEQGELTCFVEVRARRSLNLGTPAATVTRKKQRRIVLAATDYLAAVGGPERALRFDVVAVHLARNGARCEHIPGAFDVES